jgi:hypothetical protein
MQLHLCYAILYILLVVDVVRFRVWNTSSFVILTAAYFIQPYFVVDLCTKIAMANNQPHAGGAATFARRPRPPARGLIRPSEGREQRAACSRLAARDAQQSERREVLAPTDCQCKSVRREGQEPPHS